MLLGCKLDFYVRNKQFSVLKNMGEFMCLKEKKKREEYLRCVDIVINKNEQVEIMESENENKNV